MVNWVIVWSIVLGIIIAKFIDILLAYAIMYIGNLYAVAYPPIQPNEEE